MKNLSKKRASLREYTPQNQLTFDCFESPFGNLDRNNRWVRLSDSIPWDAIVNLYRKHHPSKDTGRRSVSPRILIGAVMIKHLNDYDDRETIEQIKENIYLQYFLGFTGFSTEAPFHASVFVDIRKKLTPDLLESISEQLLGVSKDGLLPDHSRLQAENERSDNSDKEDDPPAGNITHKGDLLMDASVAPQAIAYPTDLNLLNDSRQISEKIIDDLMRKKKEDLKLANDMLILLDQPTTIMGQGLDLETEVKSLEERISKWKRLSKPRTYRVVARKEYLKTAQNKNPSKKTLRRAIGKQLRFLKRNLGHISKMLDLWKGQPHPLDEHLQNYLKVVGQVYAQQKQMFDERKNRVDNRIVSIHQPHVRPIVRGKAKAKTEFGAKVHLSLINGFSFLDTISWDAFNESTHLTDYVESYKARFGYYPQRVLVDKIYWTRANRKWLKEKGIILRAKPLGRPSAQAVANHLRPGERNPIEGKFGQAKTAYGMGRIRAKLKQTSESWIASIILVLNLVNFTRVAPYCLVFRGFQRFSNDATVFLARIRAISKTMAPNLALLTANTASFAPFYRIF